MEKKFRIQMIDETSDSLSQYTESHSSSSSSEEDEEEEEDEFQEFQECESEMESSKHPTRRRSKRIRYSNNSKSESEPASSSISTTNPDEDLAYCLMMLSRDKFSDDLELGYKFKKQSTKVQNKYKCDTCDRVFRSYQALGGHRASHKKLKAKQEQSMEYDDDHHHQFKQPLMAETERNEGSLIVEKIHKCPYCFRVFASGQALGGHKRSHVMNSLSMMNSKKQQGKLKLIDLNLPASDDEEDEEFSQIEVSAVTNGEFIK